MKIRVDEIVNNKHQDKNQYYFDDSDDYFSFDNDFDIKYNYGNGSRTILILNVESEKDFDVMIKLFQMMKEEWKSKNA